MNEAILAMFPLVQGASGVADVLDFRARSHGEKEAIILHNERVTYNQLSVRARAIAHHLRSLGIAQGDKVAVYLPNGVDYVASFFGIVGMDCVLVPVNPLLKAEEIAHILGDSKAKALIVDQELLPAAMEALTNVTTVSAVLLVQHEQAGAVTPPSGVKLVELDRTRVPDNSSWPVQLKSEHVPAVIVYTSGTTGKPKGAVLTHRNLLSVFPARLDLFDIDEHDVCLGTLPLCHIYGMTVVMLGTVAKAAKLVIMPKFDARAALDLVQKEQVTIMPAVPAMYQMLLHELSQADFDLSSLRLLFSGAAPLPAELIAHIESSFGAPVIEGYALTETACVATINPLRGERKQGSVGPAVPGVRVEIFGAEGQILPSGSENIGEIAVSGPNLMQGYYQQPESTQEVLREGWFFTGDLGYKDDDGYVYIVGRKKELIIRGGFNIYPREVEEVIMRMPGVREAAVIGVPDQYMGERVKAVVATSDPAITEDSIKEHCLKYLADYKVPRLVEFVSALPRNSTGKVLKRLLQ